MLRRLQARSVRAIMSLTVMTCAVDMADESLGPRGNLVRVPYSQGIPTTIPTGFPFIEAATTEVGRYETARFDDYTTSTLKAKRVDFGDCGPPQPPTSTSRTRVVLHPRHL